MNITKFSFILMVNILLMLQLKAESITYNGLEYGIITSPITGKKWLDRNLGPLQQIVLVMEIIINGEDWLMGMRKRIQM